MDVSLGADVIGTGGKLGEIERVIVDARSGKVTDIVVKHGFVFGHERIVPIAHITGVEDGGVRIDLDERALGTMDGFAGTRLGPDPDYTGPPPADLDGSFQANLALDQTVAAGAQGGLGAAGKPLGYPGGEQTVPDYVQRPAFSRGTDVFAADGEKVGDVGELSFAHDTGAPTRIAIRRGFIFHHDTDVPVDWIREFGDDGVLLNVPKAQVEGLAGARRE